MRAGILCLSLVLVACSLPARADTCPDAEPYCACVRNEGWTLANLSQIITGPKQSPLIQVPPLRVSGIRGKPNLLSILPLNGAVDLLYYSIPKKLHNCFVPLMRGNKVMQYAKKPSSKFHSTFKACSKAPMTKGPAHSFVFGAFDDLSAIPERRLAKVPEVASFKKKYGRAFPHLGLCMAVNPCGMNIFIGLDNFTRFTNMSFELNPGVLNTFVWPESMFYSWGVSVQPPSWQTPGPPIAWAIDPQVNGSLGVLRRINKLSGTTLTGSLYVSGLLRGGFKANNLQMPTARLDMGSQKSWWGMLRDDVRRAVSMKLAAMPDVVLWDQIRLPFRTYDRLLRIHDVELTARTLDSYFWAATYNQDIPANQLIKRIPAIGNLLAKVYVGARNGSHHRISDFAMHSHGAGGAAIRLWFKPGLVQLTAAARLAVGVREIWTDWGAIFRAAVRSRRFQSSVTISLGGRPYQIVFCKHHDDCASEASCWTHCDDDLHVCVPTKPAPGGCVGTTPWAGSTASAAAAKVGASGSSREQYDLPNMPDQSPAPFGGGAKVASSAAAASKAGSECSWGQPCPAGLECRSDYEREQYVCVEP